MEFYEWMNKKFIEWCGDSRNTVTNFAKFIGVPQTVMSSWMAKNGRVPRDHATVMKLVERYGTEVYDILGQPVPSVYSSFDSFPPQIREIFERSRDEINAIYARENVPADSPEALRIAEEVLSRHGIIINSVEQLDDD